MAAPHLNIAIYAIDDDESQRIALDALFKDNDIYNYTIFSNPVDLLNALHEGVQICVLDYQLKNELYTGLTLMREILKANGYCKCIVMSGYEDAGMIKAFLNHGAFRYVTKGEYNFSTNLIKYINEALELAQETFDFYTTLLKNVKGVTDDLKDVKNG